MLKLNQKRGQIAIYVIVAIAIVSAIVLLFVFRDSLFGERIPEQFRPIYNVYSSCLESEIESAVSILGSQGGYIEVPESTLASDFSPYSNSLTFFGANVPYWFYLSSNGVVGEAVPLKSDMEREAASFIESRIDECDFAQYYAQGFYITLPEDKSVSVNIQDDKVSVTLIANLVVSKEGESARKTRHVVDIESKIGKLYSEARNIYEKQRSEAFLEEYAVDVLRLNAPVDGVSVQCSPEIWKTREVVEEIKSALEMNIQSIKFDGNYYDLNSREDSYFVVDLPVREPATLFYSRDWPSKIEITPAGNELMIADPVGNQQGLGILGFCYVPYHFVYDLSFPVMVRVGEGLEVFQFPVVVIVDNNLARDVTLPDIPVSEEVDVCQFRDGDARIYTFDTNLNPVEADVSYKCFDSVCSLGNTEVQGNDAYLDAKVPVCFNGEIIARAEGYSQSKKLFSSNSEFRADIILEREYEISVELSVDGKVVTDGFAIVHFTNDAGTVTAVTPDNLRVKLKEGSYEVKSYVYSPTSIVIPATTRTQCVDVARKGIAGILGATKEECFSVNIPETKIDQALVGGGNTNTFILESELSRGRVLVNAQSLPNPRSLEELQYNFESFNSLGLEVNFA